MIITLSGSDAFKVQTGGVTLATEGTDASNRAKPDIYLRTRSDDAALPEAGFIIKGAGEYEIREVEIKGTQSRTYVVKAEDLRIAFITETDADSQEAMDRIDIAFVTKAEGAAKFLRQASPRIVVAPESCAEAIGKELGAVPERMEKLTIKKKELSSTAPLKLVCLAA